MSAPDEPDGAGARQAADAMRALSRDERDRLIAENGVLDLRPRIAERIKQRDLARAYRAPRGGGGKPA